MVVEVTVVFEVDFALGAALERLVVAVTVIEAFFDLLLMLPLAGFSSTSAERSCCSVVTVDVEQDAVDNALRTWSARARDVETFESAIPPLLLPPFCCLLELHHD